MEEMMEVREGHHGRKKGKKEGRSIVEGKVLFVFNASSAPGWAI